MFTFVWSNELGQVKYFGSDVDCHSFSAIVLLIGVSKGFTGAGQTEAESGENKIDRLFY